MSGSVKSPESLLAVPMTTLVATFVILTEAPVTTAPEESCTEPVIVPRSDCARMEPALKAEVHNKTAS